MAEQRGKRRRQLSEPWEDDDADVTTVPEEDVEVPEPDAAEIERLKAEVERLKAEIQHLQVERRQARLRAQAARKPGLRDEAAQADEVLDVETGHLAQVLLGGEPPADEALAPVVRDVESFQRQHAYHARRDQPMACLGPAQAEAAPVDVTSLIGEFYRGDLFSADDLARLGPRLERLLMDMAERSGLTYSEHRPADAFSLFRSGLQRFLRPAVKAKRQKPPSAPAGPVTYAVEVHTRGSDLQVYASPAYWWSLNTYFGGPTTPAFGSLRAGWWRFGVEGEDLPKTMDDAVLVVPDGTEVYLSRV